MVKSLEERKKEYAEHIKEEYNQNSQRSWESAEPEYIPMKQFAEKSKRFQPGSEETIIKYNLKRALITSALFFIAAVAVLVIPYDEHEQSDYIFFILLIVLVVCVIADIFKRKVEPEKIKMNAHGIWLNTVNEWIAWNTVAATYIKVDSYDEGDDYYLVIHFHHEGTDRFLYTEFKCNNLDKRVEDIAAEIEYRKELV